MINSIDASIFRDYDIRGTYPDQINEDTFYLIGRSLASFIKGKEIAVGYDMRLSSLSLFHALSSGITYQGTDVVDLGLISTEINYFASGKYRFPANVIITASHNPPDYNGLKIVKSGVVPLHGQYGIPEILELVIKNDFPKKKAKEGKIRKKEIINEWIEHVLDFIDIAKIKPLKVVIDAGNGMGGISWKKLAKKLPIKIIPLYFEPDGHFPHHLPDPLKEENLADLKKTIIKRNANLGIAFDGDADRMFAVDEKGKTVSGTVTSAILSAAILQKYGPNPILYNVVCGRIVPETIKKYQGKPIKVRVGHSIIKEMMKKKNALFACEHSGHFYFRQNFFADSSLIAVLLLLEYISVKNIPVSKIVSEFDIYSQSGEINFKVDNSDMMLKKVENAYKNARQIDHIDGLSIYDSDWWFNMRASKTEPYVRLNIEADNDVILAKKQHGICRYIISLGGIKK